MNLAARWRARTFLPLAVAGLAAFASCAGPEGPDVVLITVDTLRADYLSPYDPAAGRTPAAAKLAAEGVVFERASAPMGMTRPSHFTMFTSLYPREHGVLNNMMSLPDEAPFLAQMLREHGYRSAGFTGVNILAPGSGVERGFEVLSAPVTTIQRPAGEIVPRALEWVRRLGSRERYFLWVHLFDPHQPYAPPAEQRGGLDPEMDARHPSLDWQVLAEIAGEGGDVPLAVLDHAKALYRAEVEATDDWIGRLLDGLAKIRDLDETLVILTSDHGECFENGVFFEHSNCLFEGTAQVPLIVRYPRDFPAGQRIGSPVGLIDVAPTVLASVGLEIPPSFSGQPLQRTESPPGRYLMLQHPFFQPGKGTGKQDLQKKRIRSVGGVPTTELLVEAERVGLVGADWKYLDTDGSEELYPMSPAPDESRNVVEDHPEVRARMKAELERLLELHRLNVIQPGAINEELLESLEALGYL